MWLDERGKKGGSTSWAGRATIKYAVLNTRTVVSPPRHVQGESDDRAW